MVQPETVIRWHRQGFRLYWRWKSRSRCGRPKLDTEIRALIRCMSRDNPTWGRRRIRSELHLLGYEVAELTVAKYMVRGRKPPPQGWRVFLKNHTREIAAIDFFTVVTLNFRSGRSLLRLPGPWPLPLGPNPREQDSAVLIQCGHGPDRLQWQLSADVAVEPIVMLQ